MSKKVYKENINQLLEVIDSNLKTKMLLPSLILIYAGIDIMAWLNRDESHQENNRNDFKNWVNKDLLPESGLNCNADDLYGARCSILHSYTAESTMSNQGMAKMICYAWGTIDESKCQRFIDLSSQKGKAIVMNIDTLNSAFKVGIQRFNKVLSKNSSLSKLVSKRTDKYFTNIPSEIINNHF
jgi:hypothetical protein